METVFEDVFEDDLMSIPEFHVAFFVNENRRGVKFLQRYVRVSCEQFIAIKRAHLRRFHEVQSSPFEG